MPEGTRVAKCVAELTKRYGKVRAIKICQTSTGQSYATGKATKEKKEDKK